eukprot:Gb_03707 [translate_table: standard]
MANSNNQYLAIAPLSLEDEDLMDSGTSMAVSNRPEEPELLKAQEDKYNGVVVELDNLHRDVDGFVSSLKASLCKWKHQAWTSSSRELSAEVTNEFPGANMFLCPCCHLWTLLISSHLGKKGVWIKVPREHAKLVPAAIEEGFWYHHAEQSYVMLVYWIPKSPCTLPANASHQVGVAAFVVNSKQEVLAVQEKNGPYRGSGLWKMPTGMILQREDVFTGAMREVKEETGDFVALAYSGLCLGVQIDTEFLEVVGFRTPPLWDGSFHHTSEIIAIKKMNGKGCGCGQRRQDEELLDHDRQDGVGGENEDPIRHCNICETIWTTNGVDYEVKWLRVFPATLLRKRRTNTRSLPKDTSHHGLPCGKHW